MTDREIYEAAIRMGKQVFRQGDVVLRQGGWIPTTNVVGKYKSVILAEGEKTGHNHTLEVDDPAGDIELYERDGRLWLNVKGSTATLKHQEHGPITLQPGTFEYRRQSEYADDQVRRQISD